jgi:hypothetical protein
MQIELLVFDSIMSGTISDDEAKEQKLVENAVHQGYFDSPRESSLVDLSKQMGIDDVEASRAMRRGIIHFVTSKEHIEPEHMDGCEESG